MKIFELKDFKKGWFIGDFKPSLVDTKDFELGVKTYKAGESDPRHLHKLSTEISVVISGTVLFSGKEVTAGQIVIIQKNEPNQFMAKTDAVLLVVKLPSCPNDKYLLDE